MVYKSLNCFVCLLFVQPVLKGTIFVTIKVATDGRELDKNHHREFGLLILVNVKCLKIVGWELFIIEELSAKTA